MTINENELADARVAWGNGMISISKAYEKSGIDDATIVANEMLDQLYGFEFGPVLFKPTLSPSFKITYFTFFQSRVFYCFFHCYIVIS